MSNSNDELMVTLVCPFISFNPPHCLFVCFFLSFSISFFLACFCEFIFGSWVGEWWTRKRGEIEAKEETEVGFKHYLLSNMECNHETNVVKHISHYLGMKLSKTYICFVKNSHSCMGIYKEFPFLNNFTPFCLGVCHFLFYHSCFAHFKNAISSFKRILATLATLLMHGYGF